MTQIPRRRFLKTAGAGALASAALTGHLHATPQAKSKSTSSRGRVPWAYTGTDNDPGVKTYPLTENNSLPALVVWLTMAVSSSIQNNMTDSDLQQLADAVGLTKNSVIGIRTLLADGRTVSVNGTTITAGDAFTAVAQLYLQIGKPANSGPYDPSACPRLSDVLGFAPIAAARVPQPS